MIKIPYAPYEVPDANGKRVRLSDKARVKIVRSELNKLDLEAIKRLIDLGVPRFNHPISGVLLSEEASKQAAFYAYENLVINGKNNLDDMRILQTLNVLISTLNDFNDDLRAA